MKRKWILLVLLLMIMMSDLPKIAAKSYRSKIYPSVSGFTKGLLKLSPDGRKVGLAYIKNGKHYVQINDRVYGGFEVGPNTTPFLKFSPDGKTFAFVFQRGNKLYLQINNQVYGDYTTVDVPVFGATGKMVCFRYALGQKWYLWINGQSYGGYQTVELPVFTADETGFGFAFRKWFKWYIQINGDQFGRFYNCWGPFLSGDGNHLGFVGQKGREGEVYYYLDKECYGPVDCVGQFSPSPNRQTFDVCYLKEGQAYLRTGQNVSGPFTEVIIPKLSAGKVETSGGIVYNSGNEKSLQYGELNFSGCQEIGPVVLGASQKLWGFTYRKKGVYYVRIGNKSYGPYPEPVVGPYFSPNENAFAFWYHFKQKIFVNINGQVYQEIYAKDFAILQLVSSSDGQTVGYQFRKNGREYVRVGEMVYGGRGTIYPGSLLMSNNGKCFAYRYRYDGQEYVQINEKVFQCGRYQSADFVITPDNRACFAKVVSGKIVIQEIDYD